MVAITFSIIALAAPVDTAPHTVPVERPIAFTIQIVDEDDAPDGDPIYVIEMEAGSLSRPYYGTMRRVQVGVNRWLIVQPSGPQLWAIDEIDVSRRPKLLRSVEDVPIPVAGDALDALNELAPHKRSTAHSSGDAR